MLAKELAGLPLVLATADVYFRRILTSSTDYQQLYKASWLWVQQKTPRPLIWKNDASAKKVLRGSTFILRCANRESDNTVPLTAEEVQGINYVDKVSWIDNEAFDDASLFESDLVERQIHASTERLYKGNKAHGRGTVMQRPHIRGARSCNPGRKTATKESSRWSDQLTTYVLC